MTAEIFKTRGEDNAAEMTRQSRLRHNCYTLSKIKQIKKMFLKLYFIALPIFLAIDMVWLGLVAKNFYAKHIGFMMRTDVNWTAAILFYLLFIFGLILFVVSPAIEKSSWTHALLFGALFGLITYATYDLTNLATVKNWPLLVTVVDMVWGAALAASVSTITYFIADKIGK